MRSDVARRGSPRGSVGSFPQAADGRPVRLLLVTIDTEEEGRWGGTFPREGNTCENVEWLRRLVPIRDEFGLRLTFLVDHPIARDARSVAVISELASSGRGEVGAHMHPWCNPPYHDADTATSYTGYLPPDVQRAKLAVLGDAIEESFAVRPTSYRAGRWGIAGSTLPLLEELGFTVDSSVTSLRWEYDAGGPSFLGAPHTPYFPDRANPCRPGSSTILEVPVPSIMRGPAGRGMEWVLRRIRPFPGLGRLLDRAGRCWLRPSEGDPESLARAAAAFLDRGLPILHIMFHSSELMPGASPYVRDEAGLEAFLARLRAVVEPLMADGSVVPATLADVRRAYGGEPVA